MRQKREAPIERVRIVDMFAAIDGRRSGSIRIRAWSITSNPAICFAQWKQLKAFLREESDAKRLRQHSVECGWAERIAG